MGARSSKKGISTKDPVAQVKKRLLEDVTWATQRGWILASIGWVFVRSSNYAGPFGCLLLKAGWSISDVMVMNAAAIEKRSMAICDQLRGVDPHFNLDSILFVNIGFEGRELPAFFAGYPEDVKKYFKLGQTLRAELQPLKC